MENEMEKKIENETENTTENTTENEILAGEIILDPDNSGDAAAEIEEIEQELKNHKHHLKLNQNEWNENNGIHLEYHGNRIHGHLIYRQNCQQPYNEQNHDRHRYHILE